jgi:monoamine oxidase
MEADLKVMWPAMHQDVVDAGYPTLYNSYNQRGLELDRMSVDQWIQATVPGGLASKFGKLLATSYNTEYGAETSDQSALNLLYLLGYTKRESLSMYGESDERYHIIGGNDQVGTKLAAALPGQVTFGSVLTAVVKRTDGRYDLVFKQGNKTVTRTADKAIFALPFSILRSSVDLTRAGFTALKMTAIRELGMGANVKLHLQFSDRHWNRLGNNGDTFSETGYQSTFDTTRAQPGAAGILTNYTGGNIALGMNQGTTSFQATQFLSRIENILPGLSAKWNNRAVLNYWPANPWTRGAYCYWRVGQVTKFGGAEGERNGNALFCGEHTSIDFQGFMNGAVETGERAATEVLVDLGLAKK